MIKSNQIKSNQIKSRIIKTLLLSTSLLVSSCWASSTTIDPATLSSVARPFFEKLNTPSMSQDAVDKMFIEYAQQHSKDGLFNHGDDEKAVTKVFLNASVKPSMKAIVDAAIFSGPHRGRGYSLFSDLFTQNTGKFANTMPFTALTHIIKTWEEQYKDSNVIRAVEDAIFMNLRGCLKRRLTVPIADVGGDAVVLVPTASGYALPDWHTITDEEITRLKERAATNVKSAVLFRIKNLEDVKKIARGETVTNQRVEKEAGGDIMINAGGTWLKVDPENI